MNSTKQQRKAARRREKDQSAAERITAFAEERGLDIQLLQPWHIRVGRKDLTIDLFPQRQKFHNVTTNERGQYDNDVEFLKTKFSA